MSQIKLALAGRKGDQQLIKACIAAQLGRTPVEVSVTKDHAPGSASSLVTLKLSDGVLVTDCNTICRLLGPQVSGSDRLVQDAWLEYEQAVLTLAGRDQQSLQAAQQRLLAALSSQQFLTGNQPSLADIAVYTALLNVPQAALAQPIQAFLDAVASLPEVQAGIQAATASQDAAPAPVVAQGSGKQSVHAVKPKRPIPGHKNILVTSALPYVNNVPHLGNIIGCVLSADCYARYCRARQYNTLFVCGTDEYGTATEAKALEEGLTCQAICDKYFAAHWDIYQWFGISCDHFGRTPTWQQTEIAQSIFMTLRQQGHLEEQTVEQLFSEAAGKFLADRFVSGTCPHPDCQFEDARGDQCDKCGRLLNPTDLVNPKCKLTGTTPVLRSTKHIFLDLPALTPQLQAYIDQVSKLGGWSANCVQTTNAWMRDGLKVRCITRDLKWGTPVPLDGYEDKVFYVWFDAPIGYISITANQTPHWEEWWKNPDEVELVQFMGKDNVPFHTVIFPATLLGTGQQWTLMKKISVTEYLNYEGTKFSKRAGTGVFGDDTRKTGIPVEVWRYYLLANRPESSDADFKWSDLAAKNNAELKNNLGNFINRTLKFVTKANNPFDSSTPSVHATSQGMDKVEALGKEIGELTQHYLRCMDRIKLREAIKTAMSISAAGNKFFQDHQIFKLLKSDVEECSTLLAACLGLVLLLAALISPFMPSLTEKIMAYLDLPLEAAALTDDLLDKASQPHTILPAGHRIQAPAPLIAEITAAQEAELRETYRGSQADRAQTHAAAGPSASSASSSKKPAKAKKGGSATPTSSSEQASSSQQLADGHAKKVSQQKPADKQTAGKKQKGAGRPGQDTADADGPEQLKASPAQQAAQAAAAALAGPPQQQASSNGALLQQTEISVLR